MESLSRGLVLLSVVAAVAVGLWPLLQQPAIGWAALGTVLLTAAAARHRFALTASIVLFFAYTSYGVTRLVAGPAAAAIPFWLAAFVGLVVGGPSWTRWRAPSPWRLPLAWWATGVALSWPAVAWREADFTFAASAATGSIVTAALIQLATALWMDRLLAWKDLAGEPADERRGFGPVDAALKDRRGFSPVVAMLIASALITAIAALYQRFVDLSWLSGDPWVRLGRATGMMGDANPMGVATAVFAPLVLAGLLRNRWTRDDVAPGAGRNVGRDFSPAIHRSPVTSWLDLVLTTIAALVLWAAAWASGGRSTLILIAAGIAGLLLAWALRRGIDARRGVIAAGAAAIVVAGLLAVILPRAPAESPIGRLVASLTHSSPGAALHEVLWRRDGYGLAAVEAIKDHPLNGVGIGRFQALAPAYYARVERRAIPPDNAQNLWRHTLAERGLLGLLPILWLTVLVVASLFGPALTPARVVVRAMVAGLGTVLLVGYPLQDAAIAMTLGALVAAAAVPGRTQPGTARATWPWAAIVVLAILGALLDLLR